MEVKDWIVMLVPIAVNGVFLFAFQLALKNKFARLEKATEYRQDVQREFLQKLKEFYEKFWSIRNSDKDVSCGGADFSESWNSATKQIQDILLFYDVHKTALVDISILYEKCINQYQILIDTLEQGAIPCGEGFQLTDKCRIDFCNEYWKMDILIKEFLKQCEQQILQYK